MASTDVHDGDRQNPTEIRRLPKWAQPASFVRNASGKVVENRGYGADAGPTAVAYRAKKIK